VTELLLDASDGAAGVAFIPAPDQLFGGRPKLDFRWQGAFRRRKSNRANANQIK
jgi:hypothetical protein